MAEAHSAVAFSFTVSPDGLDVKVNHEALKAVWYSGLRSWKKSIGRFKNSILNGIFPASPISWVFSVAVIVGLKLADVDISFGFMDASSNFPLLRRLDGVYGTYWRLILCATLMWITGIFFIRFLLKALLSYTGWMYEPRNKMSLFTKVWLGVVKVFVGRKPLLYSYQGSLPKLPVPALSDTMDRYLLSVRPLLDDAGFDRMKKLVKEFQEGIGPKLQRYLILKSWWASNYVSDWWEEYVYLRGRAPIMVNSNYYGIDAVLRKPTKVQAARAANVVYSMLQFRRSVEREELSPILLNKTVPLCSWQYERQFNTTRIPGIETDTIKHYKDSQHIVVYHKGRYFKVYIYYKHQLLTPTQLEQMFQKILDNTEDPAEGETHLAAFTAGDRVPWAKAREQHFNSGVNRTSLHAIEKAAFVLSLDEEPQDFNKDNPESLDKFGRAMLHGKGYDRWFDKSFTLVVCSNGMIGFNAEHSWADAPIMGACWESAMADDTTLGYDENGHTRGTMPFEPPEPTRLSWNFTKECITEMESCLTVARNLFNDVDLRLMMHDAYGKGFIKKCRISPDAYIQMALQLAYFRDANKFCLTYEASMTRLFREGRTETVRSCTVQSAEFVRAMDNPALSNKVRIALLHQAGETHQEGYRNSMSGRGIDRHLFCLYVVSRYLGADAPFLHEVLGEPWRLSTSQTPHQQTDKLDLTRHPDMISAGGGFGPVANDGYGVSYIIAGEDVVFFHISSKKSSPATNSDRFGQNITRALADMRKLFEEK